MSCKNKIPVLEHEAYEKLKIYFIEKLHDDRNFNISRTILSMKSTVIVVAKVIDITKVDFAGIFEKRR